MSLPIKIELPENFLDEQVLDGYTVTSEMKKVWAVELDLLAALAQVCDKYKLRYHISWGSVLGAIRHKGFIPWDDDIDVDMPRQDYDILCKVIKKELSEPYFFSNGHNEKQIYRAHSQLRNSMTTGILKPHLGMNLSFNQGIFIDIFPQENVPAEENVRTAYIGQVESQFKKTLDTVRAADCYIAKNGAGLYLFLRHLAKHIICVLMMPYYIIRMERLLTKYKNVDTQCSALLSVFPYRSCRLFDKSVLYPAHNADFEWMTVPVPNKAEEYLTQVYGDWHKFVKGGSVHGDVFFNPEKSYKEYIGGSCKNA